MMSPAVGIAEVLNLFRAVATEDELALVLAETSRRLGFRHFAMVQHVDFGQATTHGFRLHNYPDSWVNWFDENGLGVTDPVHRASHTTLTGFRWSDIPAMIPLSQRDRDVLAQASGYGLSVGYTVPAHVPGETLGSCSFAAASNESLGDDVMPNAHLIGLFAFEAGRRVTGQRSCAASLKLTTRQLECIMYVGRGKTDAEIAQILGVSPATVVEHLRHARERYNAASRAVLPVRALYDGALSFADVLVH